MSPPKIIENYILNEVIGAGQYGKVYRARNMSNELIVAIKVLSLEKFKEIPKLHEFTMNEIRNLTKIDNPNCVRFLEMLRTSNNMYLIYEYCNGGTLEQAINRKNFLSEQESIKILVQLLNGFKAMIKENILHRDLKPSNILFHNGVIKIADFGFCKALLNPQDLTTTMVGSPIYMAPEVLKEMPYNSRADIWSLGVVFFECLFGYCPYEDQSIAKLVTQIDNKELQMPRHINNISKKTEDVLRTMLVVDHRKRLDWVQLFQYIEEKLNVTINSSYPMNNFQPSQLQQQSQHAANQQSSLPQLQSPTQQSSSQQSTQPLLLKKHSSSNLATASNPQQMQVPLQLQQSSQQSQQSQQPQALQSSVYGSMNVALTNSTASSQQSSANNNGLMNRLGAPTNTFTSPSYTNYLSQNAFPSQASNKQQQQSQQAYQNYNTNGGNQQGVPSTYLNYSSSFKGQQQVGGLGQSTNGINAFGTLASPLSANKDILNVVSPTSTAAGVGQSTTQQFSTGANLLSSNNNQAVAGTATIPVIQEGTLQGTENENQNNMQGQQTQGLTPDEKMKMSLNTRVLVRERNKINFLAGVVGSLLELNLSLLTPVVAFLLTKNINIYSEQLRASVSNIQNVPLAKRLERLDLFENSNELRKFKSILSRDMSFITTIVDLFKTEITRLTKNSPYFLENPSLKNEINVNHTVDTPFFQSTIYRYIDEVFSKAKDLHIQLQQMSTTSPSYMQLSNLTRATLLHVNEMLDAFMIEEFFENFIDAEIKYTDQKYFENIRKYKSDSLQELVAHKFDYIRSKIPIDVA